MSVLALDLTVLGAYVLVVILIGIALGRSQRGLDDYVAGGRDRPWWLLLASIVATETSTVTFLSIPGFAYERNLTWLQLPLGYLIGRYVVARVLAPRYLDGRWLTAYELLGSRFGPDPQRAAAVLFIITRSLADGLRLFLTAIVLQEVVGIPLPHAVAALGLTTTAYTFLGGMRAVLWTDLVQLVVYNAGAVLAMAVLTARLPGGLDQVISSAATADKLQIFDWSPSLSDPYTLWAGLIGGAFLSLGSHGVDQMIVQRLLCARSARDAGRAVWWSGFAAFAQFALFLGVGLGLYAFYQQFPPASPFDRADRVFARFIVDELPTGALGIVLGAVFAAAMSTLSSSLNSCAASAINDLWRPLRRPGATQAELLRAARIATLGFGLVQIGVGVAGQWLQASVVAAVLAIAGFTTGIVLGVFWVALYAREASSADAMFGLSTGLALMTGVYLFTELAWPWYGVVGSVLTASAALGSTRWRSRG